MRQMVRRGAALLLAAALCCGLAGAAWDSDGLDAAIAGTAQSLTQSVPAPQVGAVGGEWVVLALARGGCTVPEGYFQNYYTAVEQYVKQREGVLHEKKYTEYARVVLALTALGADARDVAGYDLTLPLGDYEKTIWQGVNGPAWALLALDAGEYPMPQNPQASTQATRQMYVDRILECRLPGGGWSLLGTGSADPDVTGMALQALAKYRDQPAVAQAAEQALQVMSQAQDGTGGYSSWGTRNSESCVQMLVALCELGLPPDDPRFVKGGHTLLDNLESFYTPGGGFLHTIPGGGSDGMATEQGLYALAAVRRQRDGENSLYRMGDAKPLELGGSTADKPGGGLPGRDGAVKARPVIHPDIAFDDLAGHPSQTAVLALAQRGIVSGRSPGRFDPDGGVTRAEFAALLVAALGLTPEGGGSFSDVPAGAWYAGAVEEASRRGLVQGMGDGTFDPLGPVKRQEAAAIVASAARLCGLDPTVADGAVRNTLSQFPDYVSAAAWARPALAYCYQAGILDQSDQRIRPGDGTTRGEAAQMLYQLLRGAQLI